MLYTELLNSTLTIKECSDITSSDIKVLGIFIIILLLVFTSTSIFLIIKRNKLVTFSKENKLEEKYQKFVRDNKGLD